MQFAQSGQVPPGRARRRSSFKRRDLIAGLIFTSPFLIGFLAFYAYPLGASFWYSLTSFNLIQSPTFVGIRNYSDLLFSDSLFLVSLRNTAYYTIVSVPLQLVVSFAIAMLLNTRLYLRGLFRALYFFPAIVPSVVTGVLWTAMLNPEGGIVNLTLSVFHIPGPNWLGSTAWAMPALILVTVWGSGTTIVVFLAGLQDVPVSLREAAQLDGANGWQVATRVVVPLVSPVILFNFITNLIGAFQVFALPYVMTGGGPVNATLVYSQYMYQAAFGDLHLGYASAMAWILFLIIAILTYISLRVSRSRVSYAGL